MFFYVMLLLWLLVLINFIPDAAAVSFIDENKIKNHVINKCCCNFAV